MSGLQDLVAGFIRALPYQSALLSQTPEAISRYRGMPGSCFVLRSRDHAWLSLGVIQPSHDESGRNYPLVAATQLPASLELPPLAHGVLVVQSAMPVAVL